ncbi:MAG: hypothetical protein K9W43_03760 [Candidatus Thorarchaeota archaeon]|nr:hypothetical protein [Candidatus Thorarchaeota archaeon]
MAEPLSVRLCSEKSAFEVRLKRRGAINLLVVAEQVASATGMRVRVSLPAILILESETDISITMFPDGKILLRGITTQEHAEALAKKITTALAET